MKTNFLVSVVIATKNSAVTLAELLKSVKGQSYKNLEIIVVDNSSTDETLEIIKSFTRRIFIRGPERSAQRNYGVSKAEGEYILILDSDMELQKNVIKECVDYIEKSGEAAITIPEKTVGKGLLQDIRRFEREMYEGDSTIELARFYSKKVLKKVGGYDERLTGPEDYDLFYRVSKLIKTGRIKSYILHHEEGLTLPKLLQKKFYYASRGALYAKKHPELIQTQGNLLFRKSYFKNWRKFIQNPVIGLLFIIVRSLEMIWAVAGYISAVGLKIFLKNLIRIFGFF